jgi:tetratricopeptide (TPR) repeat protein
MKSVFRTHAVAALVVAAGVMTFAVRAHAQSIESLNAEVSAMEPEVQSALSNQSTASSVIQKLDDLETAFARVAQKAGEKGALVGIYGRLEGMLNRMYEGYKQKKEDCINSMQNGSECDYSIPEQLSLQAQYPLSWLRFQGATSVFSDNPSQAKKALNEAIDGFTESTLVIVQPELLRENILGRAYCERELGRYDRSELDKAVADFKSVIAEGPQTRQYAAAQQGLSTTYAIMGKTEEAAQAMNKATAASGGGSGLGPKMLHLTSLFKAEGSTSDPAKKAEYHQQAMAVIKGLENDKAGWAASQAAVAQTVRDPIAEFGNGDAFDKWFLANVLYSEKKYDQSAKYFLDAARSGKYPRAYKFAATIYYNQKRYDQVEELLGDLAKQPGNPDAQWASYMRFKIPFDQWEQGGGKNADLENKWAAAANDYLKTYPKGEWAYEPRYRLGEKLQRAGNYAEAAKMYALVTGNADFQEEARYNQAECDYRALVAASNAKDAKGNPLPSNIDRDAVRKDAIVALQETLKLVPAAERSAGNAALRSNLHENKGRAIFMLASLLKTEPKPDYNQIAALLNNYETEFPSMKDRFTDVAEMRIDALDRLGKYDELSAYLKTMIAHADASGASNDFMKEMGLNFWRASEAKANAGDKPGSIADAKLTAIAYGYFEDRVAAGKMEAKNLTGTLSILGKAYQRIGQEDQAEAIFNRVVKADPASPDANAGLARIAQSKKDLKSALELWTTVETTAAESDDVWYEAKYNIATINFEQGKQVDGCSKLAVTRSEHPNLGTPEMKDKWNALQRAKCLNQNG